MTRVRAGGHAVALFEAGQHRAQSYVLVHGIGASARSFGPLASQLAGWGHVFALDLPGFGRSPRPTEPVSIAELARVVADVITANGLVLPVVVGHSMGAQIVTELAASHPGLVRQAVLLGPVANADERSSWWHAARLLQNSAHETARVDALLAGDYARCGPRWYAAMLPHLLGYRIEERLTAVTDPVVIIRGAKDRIVPQDWTRLLTSVAPQARMHEITGAAHAVMYTHPAKVAAQCHRTR